LILLKVIYTSFVVATGGSNLTIWLLFAFVVNFFTRFSMVFMFWTNYYYLISTFFSHISFLYRWPIWHLQPWKHIAGIVANLKIIPAVVLLLFHLFSEIVRQSVIISKYCGKKLDLFSRCILVVFLFTRKNTTTSH